MTGDLDTEFSHFLLHFESLPPQDRRFMARLIIEMGRLDWTSDTRRIDERILQVTRRIAPERVPWVADRLGLASPQAPRGTDGPH